MLIRSAGILTDAFCSALLPYLPAFCTEEKEGDEVLSGKCSHQKNKCACTPEKYFFEKMSAIYGKSS